MNKKLIFTTAILFSATFGVSIMITANNKGNTENISQTYMPSYADKASGDFSTIDILYAFNNNGYNEKQFTLTNDNNKLKTSTRNLTLINNANYQVSYTINSHNKKPSLIELQKRILFLKQFNPFEKISIIGNNQKIYQDIALDWSGKIQLKIPPSANDVCISMHSNKTEICHAFPNSGGQTS